MVSEQLDGRVGRAASSEQRGASSQRQVLSRPLLRWTFFCVFFLSSPPLVFRLRRAAARALYRGTGGVYRPPFYLSSGAVVLAEFSPFFSVVFLSFRVVSSVGSPKKHVFFHAPSQRRAAPKPTPTLTIPASSSLTALLCRRNEVGDPVSDIVQDHSAACLLCTSSWEVQASLVGEEVAAVTARRVAEAVTLGGPSTARRPTSWSPSCSDKKHTRG